MLLDYLNGALHGLLECNLSVKSAHLFTITTSLFESLWETIHFLLQ